MSVCKYFGKDKVIFATKEDHAVPSTVVLPPPESSPGLILPDGEINWNCPCLGGMATGPCGVEFRDSFSCFHYSQADPKGSDCVDVFKDMQECFSKYPAVYNKDSHIDDDPDEEGLDIEAFSKTNGEISSPLEKDDTVESIDDKSSNEIKKE